MASGAENVVKVVAERQVSPPPGSVPPSSEIPLTYFDVALLSVPPIQQLFFFDFLGSTQDFLDTHFPLLELSLSRTLAIFLPAAGRLVPATDSLPGDHVIRYSDGDSVPLVLAESRSLSFHRLVANKAKEADEFHSLVPPLLPSSTPHLVAIQVTVFPGSGLSLGFSVKHVLADGSACTHFLKSLAAIFKAGGDVSVVKDVPATDRTLLGVLEPLKAHHLKEAAAAAAAAAKKTGSQASLSESRGNEETRAPDRVTRSTFVLTRAHIQKLRKRIALTSPQKEVALPVMSTFAVTCAYLWVCQTKSRDARKDNTVYFGFPADLRPRFVPPVPASYFGNCVTMAAVVEASPAELTGENGLAAASEAIQRAIRRLDKGMLMNEALSTRRRWREVKKNSGPGARPLSIDGSPRLRLYDTDFGWGRPRKVESISIESFEAVSMAESRDEDGGVEIGIVGPEDEMLRFGSYFEEGLLQL